MRVRTGGARFRRASPVSSADTGRTRCGRLTIAGPKACATSILQSITRSPDDQITRFTESGHRWLFRNFERIDSGVVAGPATVWVWATEQLVRGLTRSKAAGKLARIGFAWVHALDRAIPEGHAVDGASCLYFYGRKCPAPILPRDTVAHYRGAQRP